jgi:hypothetical protein
MLSAWEDRAIDARVDCEETNETTRERSSIGRRGDVRFSAKGKAAVLFVMMRRSKVERE